MDIGEVKEWKLKDRLLMLFFTFTFLYLTLFIINHLEVFYKWNIGVDEPYHDYLVGWIWTLLLALLIVILPFKYKNFMLFCWFLKVIITFYFDYLYESHYVSLDAYAYFANIKEVSFPFVFFDGTYNITLLTKLFFFLTHSYRACLVFYAFIGMIAMYIVALTYEKLRRVTLTSLELVTLFFFPSVLFWSHILGKDPVNLFVFSIYFYGAVLWLFYRKFEGIIFICLAFFIYLFIRPWFSGIWGLALTMFVMTGKRVGWFTRTVVFIIFVGSSIMILLKFNIYNVADFFNTLIHLSQAWAHGGSAQELALYTFSDLVRWFPWMAFSALFRPFPWEASNIFQLLAGVENLTLLWLIIYYLWVYRRTIGRFDLFHKFLLCHILAWIIIYSPIAFQNLGTASRFKLQVLPLLLMFTLHLRFWIGLRERFTGVRAPKW